MLQLEYRPLHWAAQRFLIGNVKRHDIGAIAESIKRYGFRDPLCHDANLNNGQGGIIEGNGRLETLVRLHEENPAAPPAGVKLEGDVWLIPILFGCDAENEREAIAYSLDHNLTMLRGGDRTVYEILSQDFEPDVYDLLKDQFDNGSPTTAIDGNDLQAAIETLTQDRDEPLDLTEREDTEQPPSFIVEVVCCDETEQSATYEKLLRDGYHCKLRG